MNQPLKLFSTGIVERIAGDIEKNLDRYRSGDFSDLAREIGWAIEAVSVRWDPTIASQLKPENTPDAEFKNSVLIYKGIKGMTPALARDERVWARLCHVECLDYARDRWVRGSKEPAKQVRRHFFAPGFPGCRDDNAIGRLWWNGHIAELACPGDIDFGLKRLLARANIRLQVIERADTAFRQPLVSGVVRLLGDDWFETSDAAVADFMFEVNKRSGGIIFEALTAEEIDDHLARCLQIAKLRRTATTVL